MGKIAWLPEEYFDEGAPAPRVNPSDWLVTAADGTPRLASAEGAEGAERRALQPGEIVQFMRFTDFGTIEVAVADDGSWTSEPEVPTGATLFCEFGDPDTLSNSVDEFLRNAMDGSRDGHELECYDWSDPIDFVVSHLADKTFAFVPCTLKEPEERARFEWTALISDDGSPFVAFVRGHVDLAALAVDARLGVLAAFDAFDDERISCDPDIHVEYHLAHFWMQPSLDSIGQPVAGFFDLCEADAPKAFPVSGVRFVS